MGIPLRGARQGDVGVSGAEAESRAFRDPAWQRQSWLTPDSRPLIPERCLPLPYPLAFFGTIFYPSHWKERT